MPELPEVETVVRDLRPLVVGQALTAVWAGERRLRKPWNADWNDALMGARVEAVRRRGKWIVMELRKDRRTNPHLVIHLGMTGQLTAVPKTEPAPDHLHLVFSLAAGLELRFRDVRRFGSAVVYPDGAAVEGFFHSAQLGPEPFGLDPEYFRSEVRAANRPVKALLLDQRVVAGVGNIYADEACFRARLHPGRKGQRLSAHEADRLREAIEAVLAAAIDNRGSTIRDYIGGSGLRGGFQDSHAVYGRTGRPCPTCGQAIQRVRLAGRSTHFCPKCQKPGVRKQESGNRSQETGVRKQESKASMQKTKKDLLNC